MKVTVTFRDTAVVVPCKAGWTVRDLVDQATRRYRKVFEQHGEETERVHHLEYAEGGILDMDDLLTDLVEDRDKLMAVLHEDQRVEMDSPRDVMSNGFSSPSPSPEAMHYYPHMEYEDLASGEIEVNEAILKGNTPLLVRSSSDSALAPPQETTPPPPPVDQNNGTPEPEINDVLRGALDRLQTSTPPGKMSQVNYSNLTRTVEFFGDQGPLGIHVVPYCSSLSGRTLGLHIKGIEENSRSKRENLFKEDECIVQINDTPLQDKTFSQSQEVFRQAMTSSTVCLEVLPEANKPRYEKSLIGQLFTGDGKDSPSKTRSPMLARALTELQPEPKLDSKKNPKAETRRADARVKTPEASLQSTPQVHSQSGPGTLERVSPTPPARAPSSSPTPRTQNQSPLASKSAALPSLLNLASRKEGKMIKIDLRKGTQGLGFTVVTRDSSVHGPGPILVKNILPRGAAVEDGRLQPGDRILEVNGVDMAGRSQEELVAMLRSTKQGESVSVLVVRQEDIFLPRELKGEETSSQVMEDGREQLMYEIPLNETGSAGLGVSLKGNKSRETGEDLGIFIKSIIHGGAAHKDGRLRVNDQLIAVNGESLLERSNHAAMETLRRSMSSEGNARGTIQLVVLRPPRKFQQAGSASSAPNAGTHGPSMPLPSAQTDPSNQPWGHEAYQRHPGRSGTPNLESTVNGPSHTPVPTHSSGSSDSRGAPAMDDYYSNGDEEPGFPPPPSPGAVEEMNRELALTPPFHSELPHMPANLHTNGRHVSDKDNMPRSRASKSMDLVADESNVGSLAGQKEDPSAGGELGPTLGLCKSSSLESLQTAVSEAKQSHIQARVPFHRPRPHMVRGRGCNQSFRNAIDKSYDGPSEDDDDMSDHSSGHETPASTSSRQELDEDDGKKKKKKTKAKKKEKKSKGKKKPEDSAEDLEKKNKKRGFGLLRFGKKKEDKSKDAAKSSKSRLEALSEEELDRIPDNTDGNESRYAGPRSGHATPDRASLPDVEDDDSDPNYARINNFRQPPSPQSFVSRTPSPVVHPGGPQPGGPHLSQPSYEDFDGLYAKVNKHRPVLHSQQQTPADSDQRLQGQRRDNPPPRAVPSYDELDAARRRALEYDPNRVAPRGAESRPDHRYTETDRHYPSHPRRDPYDYPTHSRPVPRDPAPYASHHQDPPAPGHPGRVPVPQASSQPQLAPSYSRHQQPSSHTGQKHYAAQRQDVPPSPSTVHRGRPYHDAVGGRPDGYRQVSPGRYISPERYPSTREHYTSPDRYRTGDERQPDPRRKNPLINAV